MLNVPPVVLYVEDEESDAVLMEIAFKKEGLPEAFRTVGSGRAAMDYLAGAGTYADRGAYPVPQVVLLDLNLPEVHGFEVLEWIRTQPLYGQLPVVVFTSSVREDDEGKARALGANDFVSKPNSPARFREVVRKLREQWLSPGELANGAPAS